MNQSHSQSSMQQHHDLLNAACRTPWRVPKIDKTSMTMTTRPSILLGLLKRFSSLRGLKMLKVHLLYRGHLGLSV